MIKKVIIIAGHYQQGLAVAKAMDLPLNQYAILTCNGDLYKVHGLEDFIIICTGTWEKNFFHTDIKRIFHERRAAAMFQHEL